MMPLVCIFRLPRTLVCSMVSFRIHLSHRQRRNGHTQHARDRHLLVDIYGNCSKHSVRDGTFPNKRCPLPRSFKVISFWTLLSVHCIGLGSQGHKIVRKCSSAYPWRGPQRKGIEAEADGKSLKTCLFH